MWIRVKFFTISCISSNLNRVEKQLLPAGEEEEEERAGGERGRRAESGEGNQGEATLTVLTHVVDRQDGGPARGTGAVEGHVDDAVRGLDAVLLEVGVVVTSTVSLRGGRNAQMNETGKLT